MVRMINAWTKTEMFVADDRVNEYKAAGCVLAADSVTAVTEPVEEEPKKTPERKATVEKTATKKK